MERRLESSHHTKPPLVAPLKLHCTVSVGAKFSVCLGPSEQKAFEKALLDDDGSSWSAPRHVLLGAFSKIDVEKAEAGSQSDQAMILASVEATDGGCSALNELAMGEMRAWVHQVVGKLIVARTDQGDGQLLQVADTLQEVSQLASLLSELDSNDEAILVCTKVVKQQAALAGEGHEMVLMSKMRLASFLSLQGAHVEARELLGTVIDGLTDQFGETHRSTLMAKGTLGGCLFQMLQAERNPGPESKLALEAVQLLELGCKSSVTRRICWNAGSAWRSSMSTLIISSRRWKCTTV